MRCNSNMLMLPGTAVMSKSPDTPKARRGSSPTVREGVMSSPELPFAKKRFGQNFLVDRGVVRKLIEAFDPRSDQTVLEIGPGRGALTGELNNQAGRVVAIEFDRDLADQLRDKFAAVPNFILIEADALTINFCEAIKPAQTARVI